MTGECHGLRMDIEEFTNYTDKLIEKEIPEELLRDLNLGINVLPDKKEERGYFIMGEYIVDELGSRIVLYHGSFAASLAGKSLKIWKREILSTLKHELQHHIESLAGEEELARREEEEQ